MKTGIFSVKIYGSRGLTKSLQNTEMVPYVIVKNQNNTYRTQVDSSSTYPKWRTLLYFRIKNPFQWIQFIVKSHNKTLEDRFLGQFDLPLHDLYKHRSTDQPNFVYFPLTWFPLTTHPTTQTNDKTENNCKPQLLLEILYEIPETWHEAYQGYNNFRAQSYEECIFNITKFLRNESHEENIIYYLLRSFSYFQEGKYELSIRDSIIINEKYPKSTEAHYRTASIHYLIHDFELAKAALKNASINISNMKRIGSGKLSLDIKELKTQILKSEKQLKELDFQSFREHCTKHYFNTEALEKSIQMFYGETNTISLDSLFDSVNTLDSPKTTNEKIDDYENHDFNQSLFELLLFRNEKFKKKKVIGQNENEFNKQKKNNNDKKPLIIHDSTPDLLNFFNTPTRIKIQKVNEEKIDKEN
ncbi:tpr repeat containing protein [Anaeramoeba flamelloides]|uniref:Tpr repeat containing protein n=1 Tax=Anaeramoeba flamelloides TaxID=1746091 RepID=A0ABQ8YPN9_9EUKA|nr:tpr repeat containing protein [Anaeramoeba flamelloides]